MCSAELLTPARGEGVPHSETPHAASSRCLDADLASTKGLPRDWHALHLTHTMHLRSLRTRRAACWGVFLWQRT